ncbi:site-specific integrase [Enterococcus ureasiticus]|uniref:site-specific integrase n=1 Tax=Enterococcus ureasiticus TaxID=903984 RepID=UPI001A906FD0|nr:site-specific integrase [Enterococcus ureasiticus]MBO0475072.1 site-specific integrase [Enterococcus ureasiticus]
MATFKQYTKKNGDKLWMFSTYLKTDYVTGKQINATRRGFKTKKEAQAALNQLLLNPDGTVQQSVTTLEEVYYLWFEVYKTTVKETTYMQTDNRMKKYVLPTFGTIKLERLDLKTAQKMVNDWSKKFGMYTKLLLYVSKVCDHAVTLDIIDSNPFKKVTKPKQITFKKHSLKYYSKEQLELFMRIVNQRVSLVSDQALIQKYYAEFDAAIFRLLAYTGMRIGEALALNWDDISFEDKTVDINKNLSQTKGSYVVSTTKTRSSNRIITLDNRTLYTLKKWRLRQRELLLANGVTQINFIFTGYVGEMVYRTDVYQRSKRLADKAGLHNIGCHGFRHTHATILFEAGISPKEIQNRLGHSDISMTLDIYTHLSKKTEQLTVDKLMKYMEN